MKKNQSVSLLWLSLICLGCFFDFSYAKESQSEKFDSNTVVPTIVLSETTHLPLSSFNLDEPARYAFVSDQKLPKLAVIDVIKRKKILNLQLNVPADIIGISKKGGYLIYAKRGEKAFFQINLATQRQQRIGTQEAIQTLIVHEKGDWLAYKSRESVVVMNMKDHTEHHLSTVGDVSLLFNPNDESLFVAELQQGRLQRLQLKDREKSQTLFELNTSMSPVSIMPNGIALFFVANGSLQRYSLLDETVTPLSIGATQVRPYMTSDSRVILVLGKQYPVELLAINAYTYQLKGRFPIQDWQLAKNYQDYVTTGWLEQVAILADNHAVYSVLLEENSPVRHIDTNRVGRVQDMVVLSDSKTLLMTREEGDRLILFNLKEQKIETEISLGLPQPNHIVMGETNTLCH